MNPHKWIPVLPLALAFGIATLVACVEETRPKAASASGLEEGKAAQPGDSRSGEAPSDDPPSAQAEASEAWTRKRPPAASERQKERLRMVETQIAHARDGRRTVKDERVLEAMRTVPRHVFVPKGLQSEAYSDYPLPIGHDQTISQPYIVAWMTELLDLERDSKVLEVGTGSGYQAAVLAHITPHVYTIEIVEPLAKRARRTLDDQGYSEIRCRYGDGYKGWKEEAPFDAIIVTCAPEKLPPPLWEQLKPGGRLVIPVGGRFDIQKLVVVTKTEDGEKKTEEISYVRFVPLTRRPSLEGKDLESKALEETPVKP